MARKRKGIPRRAAYESQMKKQKEEETGVRDWAALQDYLLEKVVWRLPPLDCLSFGSVCKPWSIISAKYMDGCDIEVPFLVKHHFTEEIYRYCFSCLGNSIFKIELPEGYRRYIWGSFQSWLFLVNFEISEISLMNPFTGENITLPKFCLIKHSYYLIVVSAAPNDENFVCMVAGMFGKVAFWSPGARGWYKYYVGSFIFLDALYYQGCFYLLDKHNQIFVFNVKDVISSLDFGDGIYASLSSQSLSIKLPKDPTSQCARHYLVESSGEVLLVCRFFYNDGTRMNERSAFDIYKLNLGKREWSKLEKLEDQILFVGSGCSNSFHTNNLGVALANNVFFVNESRLYMHDVNKTIDRCYTVAPPNPNDSDPESGSTLQKPNPFRAKATCWPGVWLTAPARWCLKQRYYGI